MVEILFSNLKNKIKYLIYILIDNEEIGRAPFPTVVRQEQDKISLIKNENNLVREMSPTSQLSQSTDETTNTPSNKDIRRDEPMLGF